jgi:6-phosphogluconate dehydrogenase
MKIGMVGLGRMGANMAQRLLLGGHEVTAFDPNADARKALAAKGASSVDSLRGLVNALLVPRFIWLMVPSGKITEDTVAELLPLLSPGDVVIDGGNSNYKDTLRRAEQYRAKALGYVDAGTSGGVWGLKEGYSLMVGGDAENIATLQPIFATLAPDACRGWGHVGPVGSGHFTKMIHNGIEYGLMQAYAEGFSILAHKREFSLDLHQIGEIWRHGSVVRSWLLDLATDALNKNPTLDGIAPYVPDSGEGRWTVSEAIELDVPAPIITLSLIARLRSRDNDSFSDKLLSAMRNEFGGHAMKKEP